MYKLFLITALLSTSVIFYRHTSHLGGAQILARDIYRNMTNMKIKGGFKRVGPTQPNDDRHWFTMSTKDYYDGNFKPNKSPIAPNEKCAAEDIMM